MNTIYTPNTSLAAKIERRLIPFRARRNIPIKLDRAIVSFTFDDCPKSVVDNALPALERENWQASLYMSMGLCGTTNHLGLHMSESDVLAAHESGHEIGDHTYDHIDATTVSLKIFEQNIDKNQACLEALGLPASETFAYPYGQVNLRSKKLVEQKFKGARGIMSHVHSSSADLNQINSNRLYAGQGYEALLKEISRLKDTPSWMTIFTHDVRDTPSEYGCSPEQLNSVISAVKKSGATVMTVANAIKHLETQNV